MSKHIEDFTLFLYAIGYNQLKEEVIIGIEEHLEDCTVCSERLGHEVESVNMLLKEREERPTVKLDLGPIFSALAKFLTAPKEPESLRWFEEAYRQLVTVLSKGYTKQIGDKAGRIQIIPRGFMSTELSEEHVDKHKGENVGFTSEEKQMIKNVSSLLGILANGNIDISERAKLTKELYTIAKQRSEDIKSKTEQQNKGD